MFSLVQLLGVALVGGSPQQNNFFGAPFGELTFQIGIGAFPFGLFTNGAYHNPGGHGQNRQQAQHPEAEQERTLAKYFIYIAIIIWVLY